MIKSLKIKNCATYSAEGAYIENCKKINFFYGANGSGKSTISKYLQSVDEPMYSSCEMEWENNSPLEVIVYNQEFRRRNIKEDIDGIFTLGQATIEEIEALDQMKEKRDALAKELSVRNETLRKKSEERNLVEEEFKEKLWNSILKQNESDFKEAFEGYRAKKEKFKEKILEIYNQGVSTVDTRENLKKKANVLLANKPEYCEPIFFKIDALIEEIKSIESDSIWGKVIVGNDDIPIAKLIKTLDNIDWVNQGRKYITSDGYCPFCQEKTMTLDLVEQLNLFFSGEYEADINKVEAQLKRYREITISIIDMIQGLILNSQVVNIAGLDVEKVSSIKAVINAVVLNNIATMESKKNEAGKKFELADSSAEMIKIQQIIEYCNKLIVEHNAMVENYGNERRILIKQVWEFVIAQNRALIEEYLNKLKQCDVSIKGIKNGILIGQQELSSLKTQIVEASKNVTSIQPTVDEINRSLKAYGFTNFQIVKSPTQKNSYQIQRMDGTIAKNTLSEGEETFISFLYFLQLAKGSVDNSKISSPRVLVLDDPISSLDSTVLYVVSSMVKSLIMDVRNGNSDVKQMFILTHNVFFHKEASFIDGRVTECKDVNFWIISKDDNISRIRAYEMQNPIKTSYELLWNELKSNTNASLITIQNIMRRIIENYFGILGAKKDNTIISSFSTVEEQQICHSLFSWINDNSHSIPDDLYVDSYNDSIDRYRGVFKTIFEKMGHEAHYNMMMGIET